MRGVVAGNEAPPGCGQRREVGGWRGWVGIRAKGPLSRPESGQVLLERRGGNTRVSGGREELLLGSVRLASL